MNGLSPRLFRARLQLIMATRKISTNGFIGPFNKFLAALADEIEKASRGKRVLQREDMVTAIVKVANSKGWQGKGKSVLRRAE